MIELLLVASSPIKYLVVYNLVKKVHLNTQNQMLPENPKVPLEHFQYLLTNSSLFLLY